MNVAIIGFILMAVLMFVLIKEKLSPAVAFIILPLLAAVASTRRYTSLPPYHPHAPPALAAPFAPNGSDRQSPYPRCPPVHSDVPADTDRDGNTGSLHVLAVYSTA